MILTILSVLVIAFGFFCFWKYKASDSWYEDGWSFGAILAWIIGGVCLIVAIVAIIYAGMNNSVITKNLVEQRNAIEYRLEHCNEDKNIMVNGGIYDDVIEYNKEVRRHKRWTHDPFVGWFYSDGPAELECIELNFEGS